MTPAVRVPETPSALATTTLIILTRSCRGRRARARIGSTAVTARGWPVVLLRLAYLGVTNALALLRLLPMSDRDKNAEILALRHQITILERQLHGEKIRFTRADRAFLAALLHRLAPRRVAPHPAAGTPRNRAALAPRPDQPPARGHLLPQARRATTHRPLYSHPGAATGPRNSSWGYRRIHGELLVLGIKIGASTVWEILKNADIDPAPERTSQTWTTFLRSQAQAITAADFFKTSNPTGARLLRPGRHRTHHPPGTHPRRHSPSDRGVGDPSRPQPRYGHRGCRTSNEVPYPRPRRQVPTPVRRHPGRYGHRGCTQRCPGSPNELHDRAVDPVLPPRATRPHAHLAPRASPARPARV